MSIARALAALAAGLFLVSAATARAAAPPELILATTTSVRDSGLLDDILPPFTQRTGIAVKVIAVGSGAALEMARKGDADLVIAHAPEAEEKLVAEGALVARRPFAQNYFVIAGPPDDPAKVKEAASPADALARIAAAKAPFATRGDESGTHQMEKGYWKNAGVAPQGAWYVSAGQGMGQVLTMAGQLEGYTLTDRATYAAYREKTGLEVLVEGDPKMFNPYGVIAVNPEKHPGLNNKGAMAFVDWITSPEGQKAIADFKISGLQMFFPSAK